MLLGSYVSMSGKKMLEESVTTAAGYGASTFMIYTGAPQNTRRKKIEDLNIDKGHEAMSEHGIKNFVVHAPYIINIANTEKDHVFNLGVDFLQEEIVRTEALGSKQIVLHPGSHVGAGSEAGIKQIVKGLNEVLTNENDVHIALETLAGKGSEVGRTFEEIAQIIDGVTNNERLLSPLILAMFTMPATILRMILMGSLNHFDKIIGIDRIKILHMNDSKMKQGRIKTDMKTSVLVILI